MDDTLFDDVKTGDPVVVMPTETRALAPASGTNVPALPSGDVLGAIMQLAANPQIDVDRIDKLIQMHERMEDRQAMREFNEAFVRMQAMLPRVKRDGTLEYPKDKNKPQGEKYFVSKFAKWETIHGAIMPVLTEHGFGLSFRIRPRQGDGGGLGVSAVLRHNGGHVEEGEPFPVPLDTSGGKNNLQAYGSSLSYGKKYAAFAALNIATEGDDDDGKKSGAAPLSEDQAHDLLAKFEEAGIRGNKIDAFLARHTNGPATTVFEVEQADFVRLINLVDQIMRQRLRKDDVG